MKFKFNVWISLAVLLLGFIFTFIATIYTHLNVEKQAKRDFTENCEDIKTAISSRMQAHAQILRTASAFMESSDTITRLNWKIFSEQSNLDKELPGIQGIGYSVIIPKNQLEKQVRNVQNEGFPDFKVWPLGDRPVYTSIVYIEPFDGRNLRAFGYDMFSEPIRRKAMEDARDSDMAILTNKVTLVQETDQDLQSGTLMYLPVYRSNLPTNDIAQRRLAIKGWVYCTYRMDDLMRGILGKWNWEKVNRIHLKIYDDILSESSLLYDSQKNENTNQRNAFGRNVSLPVEFCNKEWILNFSMSDNDITFFEGKILLVLIAGLIISMLIFFLTLSLLSIRYKAQKIAEQLTKEIKDASVVLEQSEMKYRTIFDNIRDIYLRTDLNGMIKEISPSVKKILHYDRSDLIEKPVGTMFNNNEDFITLIGEVSEKEEVSDYEVLLKNKYNGLVWTSSNIHKIFDHQGNFIGMEGIIRDIRERKIAEGELRKLSIAVEQSPVSIVITDSNGNIEYCNPKALETSGYNFDELKGQNSRLLKSGETSPTDYKELWDTILSWGKWNGVFHNKRKDGSLYFEYASISPILDPDGKTVHYLAVKEDITNRREAEVALHKSEDKYRNLIENISDVIYEVDRFGIISYVSPSVVRIFGFTPDEMVGKSITNFIKDDETMLAARYDKLVTSEDVKIEHEAVTKSGETRYILISTKAVFDNGIFTGGSGTMVDITERKMIEMKLQENETILRELNTTKDKFFSIIAHDLRTPFNAIIGLSDLLLMQIQSKDYDGIEEYAEIIQNSSQQAMNLLMNLLEWSRSQTGKLEIKPILVDIALLTRGIINLLNDSALQKSITIIKKMPEIANVLADKEMIATVLRNLIANAIKFTNHGGTITVSIEQKQEELVVAVSDNGIGIRKENIVKLFRIDESTSTVGTQNEKGTGLGLMLCKEFITKHGGKIWVESEQGKGSVFSFSIPTVLRQL